MTLAPGPTSMRRCRAAWVARCVESKVALHFLALSLDKTVGRIYYGQSATSGPVGNIGATHGSRVCFEGVSVSVSQGKRRNASEIQQNSKRSNLQGNENTSLLDEGRLPILTAWELDIRRP